MFQKGRPLTINVSCEQRFEYICLPIISMSLSLKLLWSFLRKKEIHFCHRSHIWDSLFLSGKLYKIKIPNEESHNTCLQSSSVSPTFTFEEKGKKTGGWGQIFNNLTKEDWREPQHYFQGYYAHFSFSAKTKTMSLHMVSLYSMTKL